MELEYPAFRFERRGGADGSRGVWRGTIQPFAPGGNWLDLLDDISHDRDVYVQQGQLHHLSSCASSHCRHEWMDKVKIRERAFEIEIVQTDPRMVPRCYVHRPVIAPLKRRHMWGDGAVCAFMASEDVWVAGRDTVADAMPYFVLWLAKWTVFDQSGGWIGREHQNDPAYHLREVGRNCQCWCGSGLKYKQCHLHADQDLARRAGPRL